MGRWMPKAHHTTFVCIWMPLPTLNMKMINILWGRPLQRRPCLALTGKTGHDPGSPLLPTWFPLSISGDDQISAIQAFLLALFLLSSTSRYTCSMLSELDHMAWSSGKYDNFDIDQQLIQRNKPRGNMIHQWEKTQNQIKRVGNPLHCVFKNVAANA